MTEVLFYHLCSQPPDRILPNLLEKSLERGWRVAIQAASDERVDALDALLWTYREDSFLPHGTYRDGEAAAQPILLTIGEDNRNNAAVRFLIDGTVLPQDARGYARIVLLFDGDDPDALSSARAQWALARDCGFEVAYWKPDEQGRWRSVAVDQ
jgi:DNA polymerase-3 subunit chi